MTTLREYVVRDVLTRMDIKTAWEAGFDIGSAGIKRMPVCSPIAVNDAHVVASNGTASGNVMTNDLQVGFATVFAVDGDPLNVGVLTPGSSGGLFLLDADGSWQFDPNGEFDGLSAVEVVDTSITYTVSAGDGEATGELKVSVSKAPVPLELVASVSENSAGASSYDIPLPEGVQPGDLVIVANGCVTDRYSTPDVGVVPPSGYSRLTYIKTVFISLAIDYKIMGETPDASVTVKGSFDATQGDGTIVLVYRGADATTPFDVSATTANESDVETTPQPANNPSITPVTPGAHVVAVVGWMAYSPTGPVVPSGYGNLSYEIYDPAYGFLVAAAERVWRGDGAEDAPAWGNSTTGLHDEWVAATMAIRPMEPAAWVNAAPVALNDTGMVIANYLAGVTGNVLTNDSDADFDSISISKVGGLSGSVGVPVAGSNGGLFTVNADGGWGFNPDGDFSSLTGAQTAETSVSYHVSDGSLESNGLITVTVTASIPMVQLVSEVSSVVAISATATDVTLPTSVIEGDLVLVSVATTKRDSAAIPSIETSGYTVIASQSATDSRSSGHVLAYKIMGPTPDSSVSVLPGVESGTEPKACALVRIFRGVDVTTPIDVVHTVATGINTSKPNPPAITPTTDKALILICASSSTAISTTTTTPPTPPDGFSVVGLAANAASSFSAISAQAERTWHSGDGEIDPAAWSAMPESSSTWSSWTATTIALRPKPL